MATNNSLLASPIERAVTEFECNGEKVKLTAKTVRDYLVNGSGKVSDQEVVMYINLCKYQRLNPFLREAYLVKYSDTSPAAIVVGKEAFTKRARRCKSYKGSQAGIVVQKKDGSIEQRIGTLKLQGEDLVGGWARVYVEGDEIPTEITASFDEYAGRKGDGSLNAQWKSKPATMIRKVALVQALREAFPESFEGMYSAEELAIDETALSSDPVEREISAHLPETTDTDAALAALDPLA
ncbi:MAG: phage recombination protein Bet [Oscillospiraceae bacterium]